MMNAHHISLYLRSVIDQLSFTGFSFIVDLSLYIDVLNLHTNFLQSLR